MSVRRTRGKRSDAAFSSALSSSAAAAPNFEIWCFPHPTQPLSVSLLHALTLSTLSHTPHPSHKPLSEQLELLEEKLRELAALPRGDSRSDDDRAVALSQVDALRKELALVCRAGLPSVVFGKVRVQRRERMPRSLRCDDGERASERARKE